MRRPFERVGVLHVALALLVGALVFLVWQGAQAPLDGSGALLSKVDGDWPSDQQTMYRGSMVLDGVACYSDVLHFEQGSILLSMVGHRDGAALSEDDSIEAELHRIEYGVLDAFVGSRRLARNGSTSVQWEHVGPGDYYVKFVKADDGQRVTSLSLNLTSVNYF